ncbi:hypothetical protein [Sphingomonas japonica]|uniref:Lipoprotein n=1 Tax=Sphingomonas japonica TaxID=511662 RepID=A0ABX0U201_9SPHN|nr:hypothetical protein [Sphingomonas japonica]NIJ23381.1 hypothetical protein [Sphingomonas japonica]
MRAILLAAALVLAGCEDNGSGDPDPTPTPTPTPTATPTPGPGPSAVTLDIDFSDGASGWLADYADYSQGMEEVIGFTARIEDLPAPLASRTGFLLSSENRSDDVFMYLTRPVADLAPNQAYRVDTDITIASNAPAGCFGIGGAPGEAVTVKAGASGAAPARMLDDGLLSVNFDKANQAEGGDDVAVLGNVAADDAGDCSGSRYGLKQLSSDGDGPVVESDAEGRLWLVIGTDSGYEGLTALYYLGGEVTLTPVD